MTLSMVYKKRLVVNLVSLLVLLSCLFFYSNSAQAYHKATVENYHYQNEVQSVLYPYNWVKGKKYGYSYREIDFSHSFSKTGYSKVFVKRWGGILTPRTVQYRYVAKYKVW